MLPIRLRLTLWYVLLMASSFAAVGALLLVRFQRSLQQSLDESLRITVSQTVAGMEVEEDLAELGRLVLEIGPGDPEAGFAVRLVSASGEIWGMHGDPQAVWGSAPEGLSTHRAGSGASWRVLSEPIRGSDGLIVAHVQSTRSLEDMNAAVAGLLTQFLWGTPVVLLLAGAGGYFLAGRALAPIRIVTAAARDISTRDLSMRIGYSGAADEIGDLARTFDAMLTRLEEGFSRERRFTADAAHELRTPLTALKGQLEVTMSRPRFSAEYAEAMDAMRNEVDRLIALSGALLFLSRADQDRLAIEQRPIDLRELLEIVVEQFAASAAEKSLVVESALPDLSVVNGDPDHLARIFANLMDNAVKYTPSGGRISVLGESSTGEIVTRIYNSGPGIPAEHLPFLFDRFYRVETGRSRASGGAGLGLNIARELARLHGGDIRAESSPEHGTTFTVLLPKSQN